MKLRYGYLFSGIVTGIILVFSYIQSLPDGKLRIVFCDVGQGDSVYIRFPDGRDMIIDGGPNDKVLQCLGRHMPFWDRHINIIALSHPQKDHMQGLIGIVNRYSADYFIRSDIRNSTEGYDLLQDAIKNSNIRIHTVERDDLITIGQASLSFIWPSSKQTTRGDRVSGLSDTSDAEGRQTLGETTENLNDFSLVFVLRYGSFDALFPGDADSRVEQSYTGSKLADDSVELLKVPHHGSKTGMTSKFMEWIKPAIAIISVGKNSYGHPSKEALNMLTSAGSTVYRTDQSGDIIVTSDGAAWSVVTSRK